MRPEAEPQSQTKVVGTRELNLISPITGHPNQCWKMSLFFLFFFPKKREEPHDYQHCKWGVGVGGGKLAQGVPTFSSGISASLVLLQ